MFVFFSRMKKQKISHCRSSSLSGLGTSTSIKQGGITQVVHGHKPKQFYWWVELWLCNSIFTATAKDLSNTNADNQDKCNCSNELESCLPTTFCSTEDMISRFENCLKTGCCPHVVPLEHNDASRTVSGFYWIHLAIILNKFTLFKELIPFFLMSRTKSNMNWFTVDNG